MSCTLYELDSNGNVVMVEHKSVPKLVTFQAEASNANPTDCLLHIVHPLTGQHMHIGPFRKASTVPMYAKLLWYISAHDTFGTINDDWLKNES